MISIIIPAYNRERYIEKCVLSALSQSYEDIEVIIVDDGSNDSTGSICDNMASNDKRIKVIHQTNEGVSAARYAGLKSASGEWICFLDSDDTLPQDALQNYSRVFDNNPDIIVSGYSGTLSKKQFILGISDYSISPELWGKLYNASFIKQHMPELPRELIMGEDMIANLVLGLNVSSISTLEAIEYNLNRDNDSSIMKTFKKSFEYENYFIGQLNHFVLEKSKGFDYSDTLFRNKLFLQLNGYKNVVIQGNRIDVSSSIWKEFKKDIKDSGLSLAPSDKIFFVLEKHQKSYSTIMKSYLKIRQSI